jgi:L-asparaginase II
MTANPIVVEVTRGPLVESCHRGALAIADADGRIVLSLGDTTVPVYPRSAVKPLQALPLVEDGAARAFNFTDAEIALACASHNGEPVHVETARSMLAKAGLDENYLECGPQQPARDEDRLALREAGIVPGRIYNNCSGKHAGMLAAACFMGVDPRGYSAAGHPLQQRVRQVMEEMTGASLTAERCGIDGCSIPTWAAPLDNWAIAFARLATGRGVAAGRADALEHVRTAATSHPFMVAGTGRFCTVLMDRLGTRAFVKTGAEGVYCAALPGTGLGVALKIDDGATRAAEIMMAAATAECAGLSETQRAALSDLIQPPIKSRVGIVVGESRVAGDVRARLATVLDRP